ncbi:ATP synthase subunit I [Photobacterium sanguinicancri]|uniref:ATP synthase subunit I n=1 Tax=Photobacterium sanguinicancri TaxID=875932 RepID=A0AAW7XYR2_9GAMM|nr:ATP synthase subunit I [Photobacterium sanguinicancri]MDO6541284.1 ATP synthase subunit I [Photobacterium sanguinicancri]
MESYSPGSDIISVVKSLLLAQSIVGAAVILYQIVSGDSLSVESALIGVAVAVVPSLLGLLAVAVKVKRNKRSHISELAWFNESIKLTYTAVLMLLVSRFIEINEIVMLIAYSLTYMGSCLTPILNKPQFRMT